MQYYNCIERPCLGEKLKEFWDLSKWASTIDEILGIEDWAAAESALGRLTEAPISRVVGQRHRPPTGGNLEDRFPIRDDVMEGWIDKIFFQSSPSDDRRGTRDAQDSTLGTVLKTDPYKNVTPGKLVSVRRRTSSHSADTKTDVEHDLKEQEVGIEALRVIPYEIYKVKTSVVFLQAVLHRNVIMKRQRGLF